MASRSRYLLLAWAAGLAYCSFPLAFVLNPAYALHGLASILGEADQPFAWVFNTLDYTAGGLAIVLFGLLLARHRPPSRLLRLALLGGLINGMGTMLAAFFVMPGDASAGHAGLGLVSNPNAFLHGLGSAINVGSVFVAMCLWGYYHWRRRKLQWRTALPAITIAIAAASYVCDKHFPTTVGLVQRAFFVCYLAWLVVFTKDVLDI